METRYILGISCGFHDSAAALIGNGKILGAVEEERFTGIKHDSSFPSNSINWLLEEFQVSKDDIECIAFYEKPEIKLDRIEKSTKVEPNWKTLFKTPDNKILKRNQEQYDSIIQDIENLKGKNTKTHFVEHHQAHVAYSYYTSSFKNAIILSVDGVGEWETTSIYKGVGNKLEKLQSIDFPHSLGMIYSTFTAFLGFKPNEGEYKVMGLAPYGNHKKYLEPFRKLYTTTKDGGFEINMDYFTFDWSDTHMFNEKLGLLFGLPNRLPEEELTQDHKDLAATLQYEYEYLFFRLIDRCSELDSTNNLCLSGGCAYNGTANGKILDLSSYTNLWIPPAPSDAGSAIGCALDYFYSTTLDDIRMDNKNPYLGPLYSENDIKSALKEFKDQITFLEKPDNVLIPLIAKQISQGMVIGWFEGRLEFGARALGNRSILANPCDPEMKAKVNRIIKKREGFRPFAPIVRWEAQTKYFMYPHDVPYMNQVVKVNPKFASRLPAITHVDNSARIQSLKKGQHKRISLLIDELEKLTGFPIVLNTSFNLKDQTMVNDPKTAIQTFLNCEMDTLIIENYIIKKKVS
jgi:carbamoyltransferase